MSGSNPFDDLADEEGASDGADDVEPSDPAGSTSAPPGESSPRDPAANTTTRTDRNGSAGDTADEEATVAGPTLTNSSPPFPYSEAEQKQMYVRDGLWDEFEDLGFDAESELRRSFEVRNVEQRELDTAVVRLVLDRFSAREIAETVVRMRGFDPADES